MKKGRPMNYKVSIINSGDITLFEPILSSLREYSK
jgi:hypothetical protein